jgi:hypothetical protein
MRSQLHTAAQKGDAGSKQAHLIHGVGVSVGVVGVGECGELLSVIPGYAVEGDGGAGKNY